MATVRNLVIVPDRRETVVDQPVGVTVRDERGRRVEGATVAWGPERVRTDDRGRCAVTVQAPGFCRLRATAPGDERVVYRPATTLLRVLSTPEAASHRWRAGAFPV